MVRSELTGGRVINKSPVFSLTSNEQWREKIMADDRMKNSDLDKNMGGKENEGGQYGQQTPSRNQPDDQSSGQRGGSRNEPGREGEQQQGGFNKGSQGGGQSGNQGGSNR